MKNKTILLAEDESIIALDVMNMLVRNGFKKVIILADGETLLKRALTGEADLIITDILLKNRTDGIEAVEKIWEKISIPVIFISAMEKELLNNLTFSEYEFVKKPFKETEILGAITRLLKTP